MTRLAYLVAFVVLTIACGGPLEDSTSDTAEAAQGLSATSTPSATLTATPSTVAVGGHYQLKLTSSGAGSSSLAMGITAPVTGTKVSAPAGATCRASHVPAGWLYYCSVPAFSGTQSLVVDVPASAAGTFTATAYARNATTLAQSTASATIVVK
jgi:hypothetical protein